MILPPRPLRLSKRHARRAYRNAILLMLPGLALLAVPVLFNGPQIRNLRHDQRMWREGIPAEDVRVEGKETSHSFIINDYDLKVDYTDKAGTAHNGRVEFDLLLVSVNQERPVEVRFDPAHPDDFALSWALDNVAGRWLAILFFIAVFTAMAGGLVWTGYRTLCDQADARACAQEGEELELVVVSIDNQIVNGRRTKNLVYRYRAPDDAPDGKPRSLVRNPNKQRPLFLDGDRRHMLGLRSPRTQGRITVLHDDFAPFELTDEEQRNVHARLEKRNVGSRAVSATAPTSS